MNLGAWLIWLVVAFLCGSIPFAVILGRFKGVDIRTVGSGNPGASNLGRAVGKKWGIFCFVLDVLKGLLPVILCGFAFNPLDPLALMPDGSVQGGDLPDPAARPTWWAAQWVAVAIAAVLGHIFSPFLKFRGGKGVATGLGAALGLFPVVTVPGVAAFALWYAVCKGTGYVGLASVVAAASLPVLTVVSGLIAGLTPGEVAVFAGLTALLAGLVIYRHRGNLARLRAGTEPKAAWTGRGRE